MFKKKLTMGIGVILLAASFATFAAVLTEEWTQLNDRFCKYSDGTVKKIGFSETCPRSN